MKLAILVPWYKSTQGRFTFSLARMLVYTQNADLRAPDGTPIKLEIQIIDWTGSDLPKGRTKLLRRAMEWGARYALWLDDDHEFPPDTALRLMTHGVPVVALSQPCRLEPTRSTAFKDGEWINSRGRPPLEQVDTIGLGVCLMDLAAIAEPLRSNEEPFARRPGMGEDTSFMATLREAGIPIYCDHTLSLEVGHIAETVLRFGS